MIQPLVLMWCAADIAGVARAHLAEWVSSGRATGAAFVAVEKGEVTATEYAGAARPDSLWRVASVTKTLTAMAALRLAERKQLELDTHTGDGITLRHLLAHTSGLDDRFVGSAYVVGPAPPSVTAVMKDWTPRVIHRPGEARLYSNFGYGLLGARLEAATRRRFEEVLEAEVLQPLALSGGTLEQPLPLDLLRRLPPMQERTVFGRLRPAPVLYHRSVPASAWTTPLSGLVRLIRAVQGRSPGFLSAESLDTLRREFMAYGDLRGHHYWYSGGDLGGHHTVVLWLPESDQAFAVVAASASVMATSGLIPKIAGVWLGPEPQKRTERSGRAPGVYRPVRYPHNDLGKTFMITMDQTGLPAGNLKNGVLDRSWERLAWYDTGTAGIVAYFGVLLVSAAFAVRQRTAAPVRWLSVSMLVHGCGWLGAVLIADPQRLILGIPWYLNVFLWSGPLVVCPLWLSVMIRGWPVPTASHVVAAITGAVYLVHAWYWRIVPHVLL